MTSVRNKDHYYRNLEYDNEVNISVFSEFANFQSFVSNETWAIKERSRKAFTGIKGFVPRRTFLAQCDGKQ